MSTVKLFSIRLLLLAFTLFVPKLQWAQQGQGMTRSQAVAAGLVSAADVAEGDNTPMLAIPGDPARRPALGERQPEANAQNGQQGNGASGQQAGSTSGGTNGEQGNHANGQDANAATGGQAGDAAAPAGEAGAGEAGAGVQSTGNETQGVPSRGGFRSSSSRRQGGAQGDFQGGRFQGVGNAGGVQGGGAADANTFGGAGQGAFSGNRRSAPEGNTVQALVMRDQGLPEVLNYLELLTQKAILRSQSLPAVKINFDSVGPMSRQEAIIAIESLLALNGIAVTPVGERFLKAASIAEVAKQVPQFLAGSAFDLPASQQFYTKYFKLDYLDALNEGQAIVQGLLSVAAKQEGNPVIFPKSNSIMVTDMLINLQRIEEVLQRSDRPHTGVTQLSFFQLKHVKAEDLKRRLTTLISNKDSSIAAAFSHNTTFEADERTNQLIVATHESNLPLLRQLVEGLDSDVEPQTTSEVYYIKHAEAVEIQKLLETVINGQQQAVEQANSARNTEAAAASRTGGQPAAAPAAGQPAAAPAAGQTVPAPAAVQAGMDAVLSEGRALRFSNFITVAADERANAVVAFGTRTDLEQIGKLIDKIDVLLAQVNIQVIIAEVTLSDGIASGIEQLSLGYGTDGWSLGTSGASYTGGDSPFDFKGTLDPKSFSLIINNAKTNSNFRMLSAPVIVTTHNKSGRVDVTEQRPIITGTSTQLLDNPVTTSTVSYQNIGIKLTVKPLIGNNGIIQMEILQEVENITGFVTVNGNDQPIIATRLAESYVSVRSGEVVVLAGLQESSLSEKDNSLWLIGDIPLIGDLLNGSGKIVQRRELMIFIQPFVMTTDAEISQMTEQAINNLDNARDVRTYLETRDASSVTVEQARAAQEEDLPEVNRPVTRPRRGGGR